MSDNDTDTGAGAADAGANGDDGGDAGASGAAAKGGQDQVSLLTSRLNGQTAKVGELTRQMGEKDSTIKALQEQIKAFESGKVSADEAANARVAAIQKELDAERASRKTDMLKARFPETFSVFGDTASTFTEDVLAASEARLKGAGEGGEGGEADEPPTPGVHNESKTSTAAAKKPPTLKDMEAQIIATPLPDGWS